MNISVQIERLILEGVTLAPEQRALLKTSLEAELGRLLATEGLSPSLQSGGWVSSLPAPLIQLDSNSNPTQMGQQIARAVYGGLGS
ncbi:MAG: hypothetical protein AAGF83_12055 [Cyanobacteria bacterium P01_G01_bin.67]